MTYPGSRSHTWVAGERVDADVLNPWGPPNVGWGLVAPFATKTSNQGSITTITDISGLSVTFTAVASRSYKITCKILAEQSSGTTADYSVLKITDGSNTAITASYHAVGGLTTATDWEAVAYVTPGAGSVTYKARFARHSGAGTLQVDANSGEIAYFAIEDVGPSTP